MRSTSAVFAGAEKLFLWWKAAKRLITHSRYLFTPPHGSEGMRAEREKNRIKKQFNKYILSFNEARRARERSPIAKKLWLPIHPRNFGSHLIVLPHYRETNVKCHTLQLVWETAT